MPLYHFSEDPNIEIFVPRSPVGSPDKEARVWAIDEWHSPLYFLPWGCPRATFWPIATTTEGDKRLYWPDDRIRMVIAIEYGWFDRFLSNTVYRYTMPEETFLDCTNYGAYVSEETVIPTKVEDIGPLWKAMADASVDFRVMPSLKAFAHQIMETSFHWSLIRMRNAVDWDLGPGQPVMPKA